MTNVRYQKGRCFEYQVKKYFEDRKFLTIRSAGSHSIADLVALPLNGIPYLIQCKTGSATMTKKQKEEFRELGRKYYFNPILAYRNKRRLEIEYL